MQKINRLSVKGIKFIGFIIGVFLLIFAGEGNALTIVQTLSTPSGRVLEAKPPLGDPNGILSFQKFNPVLENGNVGILESIAISMVGNVLSDISLTNTGATTVNLSAGISGDMYLQLAGSDIIDLYDGSWISTQAKNVAPGATAYRNDLTGTNSGSAILTNANHLALFTGTDLISLLAYTDFMTTTGTSGGSTDFSTIVSTWAWEEVTLTYNYTDSGTPPVPESASILLIGTGLLGFGIFIFSKSKNHHLRMR